MAALTSLAITGPTTGTQAAPAAVATTDTIAEGQFGSTGCLLRVINGAGAPITTTISDPGATAMGNTSAGTAVTVTNGTAKTIFIPKSAINPSTGIATITHSSATTITYELYRI